jgi:hypothetical protein
MYIESYYNHETHEILNVSRMPDIEYTNPIQRAMEIVFSVSTVGDRSYYTSILQSVEKKEIDQRTQSSMNKLIELRAAKQWEKFTSKIRMQVLPHTIANLLEGVSKTQQQSILKNISFSSDSFCAFLFIAYENYGYLYSFYSITHLATEVDERKKPMAAYIAEDGIVNKFGDTSMSDGQIKQMIEHRHCLFANFIDRNDEWHCFFYTFKSHKGLEKAYGGGKPHMHYISSKWGLSREYVLKQLRSKRYKLPSLHINYET